MQDIIKAHHDQQQKTMKREALACNIIAAVLSVFALSTIIMWATI